MADNRKRPAAKTSKRAKAKKKSKISKIIIFTVEILVISVLLGALWIVKDFGINEDGTKSGPLIVDFKEDDLVVNEQVQQNEHMQGYRNIALFGVDSRSGELTKRTLSDSIMIASINQDTGDIKLVSVYRDTYLNLSNDKYGKCNSAYSFGGAEQAIKMLNMNLDLDIKEFVTVGFEGLSSTIDELGGVWLDVDKEELKHINSYQKCMAEDLKDSWKPVENTGYQLLNGLQATAYCRIRYRTGNDFARAAAQREVIQAIATEAKKADITTLTKVANTVSSSVYTSLSMDEIIGMLGEIAKYNIVEEDGFPQADMRGSSTLGSKGSCVYAVDLDDNVKWLHEFLFQETDYEPSKEVKEYSNIIHNFVSQYTN
ncbi:MAG TPA: LCP family protein, partial [Lachnospiraceae bacterium]|nr:LCP family protein [Lachnospiraceae bacterium]